jgi:hypothetical protein
MLFQFPPDNTIMESNIKTEPEREVEPSLFVDDAAKPAQPSSEVIYKPLWKKRQDTLLRRVEVEEQSLSIAIPQVLDLKSKISEYAETIPSVRIIVDQIGESADLFFFPPSLINSELQRFQC